MYNVRKLLYIIITSNKAACDGHSSDLNIVKKRKKKRKKEKKAHLKCNV